MLSVATVLIMLVVLGIVMSRECGGWLELPVFPITYWLLAMGVPLALQPSFPVSAGAVTYIGILLCVWGAGAFAGLLLLRNSERPLPHRQRKRSQVPIASLRNAGLALSAVGILIGSYSLRSQGYQLGDLLSIDSLEAIARANASQRYRRESFPPVTFSIALGFVYAAAALNGAVLAQIQALGRTVVIRKPLTLGLPIVVALSFGVVENTKATPLYAAAFFVAGLLASRSANPPLGRASIAARFRAAGTVAAVGLSLGIALVLMQRMRYGLNDTGSGEALSSLRVWAFGHLGGFSYWYDEICCEGELTWGRASLNGVYTALADDHVGPVQLPKPLGPDLYTNVDTAFSELLADFGLAGSLILTIAAGAVSALLFVWGRQGSTTAESLQVLPFAMVIWSFTTSLGNYSSCLLAAVLVFAVRGWLSSDGAVATPPHEEEVSRWPVGSKWQPTVTP